MEHLLKIDKTGHALDLLSKFDEFRINQQYCDFIIKAGEKEIFVHKCVIAASSEYFAKMLNHDTKENRLGMVDLKNVDPECVMTCIEIMYTGQASFLIKKTEKLMYVAHLFGINKACDAMSLFLNENLELDSFFDTRNIADMYSCQQLQQACRSFAHEHFHAIMKRDEFKELEFEFLENLISSEDLKMLDVIKCKAAMIWFNENLDRSNQLFDLLQHIDLQKIPISYRKFLSQQQSVAKSTECMTYVMKSLPEKSYVEASDYKGGCTPGILMVNVDLSRLMWFDIDRKSVTELRPFNYIPGSVVVMECYIYVIDLKYDLYYRNFLENDSLWKELERSFPYYSSVVACKSGKFYVANEYPSCCLAQYDINNNHWSKLPNKQCRTLSSAFIISQHKLYVIGGSNGLNNYIQDVECFSFSTSTWSIGPSLPDKRTGAVACTLNKSIYVLGGLSGKLQYGSNILLLPHDASIWTQIPLPNLQRSYFATYCVGGKVYICGGFFYNRPCTSILEFYPKTNLLNTLIEFDWQDLKSLDLNLYSAGIIL